MTLSPGSRLGPCKIVALIGAGGIAEVYRARDARLDRDVAIKVLYGAFSGEPDRLRRFEQEARATAALNHPNILAVHDIGTHPSTPSTGSGQDSSTHSGSSGQAGSGQAFPYIVSELLDGTTLRTAIGSAAGGGVAVRKAIDYAIQIARGLSAAHDKGIVHRDLKPDNVFVTTAGHVKILDFGLAKLIEAAPPVAGLSEGLTVAPSSEPGMVLGTIGYMAPEQVRAQAVDHRADIFAFGAILYEMLSGQRAFSGASAADTMTAILERNPPDLPLAERKIPPGLARIVDRCLEKHSAARFQTAADLAFALEGLSSSSASSAAEVSVSGSRSLLPNARRAWLLAGAASVASLLVGIPIALVTSPITIVLNWRAGLPK